MRILKPLILLLFIASCVEGYAQKQRKVAIGLSSGVSLPIRNFANANVDEALSGKAKVGANVSLSFLYNINKRFGLVAQFFGQLNPYDESSHKKQLTSKSNFGEWKVAASDWQTGGLLVGGITNIPIDIKEKNNLQVRVLFGFLNSFSPKVRTEFNHPSYGLESSSSTLNTRGGGYSYKLGIGWVHKVSNSISFTVNADYFGARMEYNSLVERTYQYGQVNYYNTPTKQHMETVNLTIGAIYTL